MDNLTHTLTGYMLSRAGLDRLSPGATIALLIAANIPDVDVVTALAGSATYLEHHRGITHGLVMAPVMALLPLPLVWLFRKQPAQGRRVKWVGAWAASLAGVLSHLLLDWTNIYGVRLLAPFSGEWLRLDITSVVDPWIWVLLAGCVLWPMLAGLVAGEIGARSKSGPGAAQFALLTLTLYTGGRYLLHQRAIDTLDAHLHNGGVPVRAAAFPSPANPLRWIGLAELNNAYVMYELNLARTFDTDDGRLYYKAGPTAQTQAAKQTYPFQAFLTFSQFPLWRLGQVADPPGAMEVEAIDLRFGVPGEGRFSAQCIVDAIGQVSDASFQFGRSNEGSRRD
ncbi:MAG: metal-dependent hydrolase [Acidobacteriia bacterium]|nr:metal-dependent hydrolase [Terriglobia bacterium]